MNQIKAFDPTKNESLKQYIEDRRIDNDHASLYYTLTVDIPNRLNNVIPHIRTVNANNLNQMHFLDEQEKMLKKGLTEIPWVIEEIKKKMRAQSFSELSVPAGKKVPEKSPTAYKAGYSDGKIGAPMDPIFLNLHQNFTETSIAKSYAEGYVKGREESSLTNQNSTSSTSSNPAPSTSSNPAPKGGRHRKTHKGSKKTMKKLKRRHRK